MGGGEQFVRVLLQSGKVDWGYAVRMSGKSYAYRISTKKFYDYMGII
jgi:chromosome segregation and condensation protein ScpB